MKLGIVLIAIGVGDIVLTLALGAFSATASIRFAVDIFLILLGIRRIYRAKKQGLATGVVDEKTG